MAVEEIYAQGGTIEGVPGGLLKSAQFQVPTSGIKTSSGQFTAIFALVALILGLVGYHYTPTQVETWAQTINNLLVTLGPILTAVPVLITYINSRGKIASNAINANAASAAPTTNTTVSVNK